MTGGGLKGLFDEVVARDDSRVVLIHERLSFRGAPGLGEEALSPS